VVVLLDGVSFSTAEIFAAVLGELPNVTLVGATTGGGGGGYAYFTLPSGARIRIPVQGVRRYDGVDVEWNGIPPDVEVLQDPRRLDRGEDVQLEAALQMLR
jgi:C-terminal processing protease CtpA/Prc